MNSSRSIKTTKLNKEEILQLQSGDYVRFEFDEEYAADETIWFFDDKDEHWLLLEEKGNPDIDFLLETGIEIETIREDGKCECMYTGETFYINKV